jgi:addiction module HigA family antidote
MKRYIKSTKYPGEAIHWWLTEHKLGQAWLARMMGRPEKTLSEIMTYKTRVTAETAVQIENITGISARFLLQLQNNLDLDKEQGLLKGKDGK